MVLDSVSVVDNNDDDCDVVSVVDNDDVASVFNDADVVLVVNNVVEAYFKNWLNLLIELKFGNVIT